MGYKYDIRDIVIVKKFKNKLRKNASKFWQVILAHTWFEYAAVHSYTATQLGKTAWTKSTHFQWCLCDRSIPIMAEDDANNLLTLSKPLICQQLEHACRERLFGEFHCDYIVADWGSGHSKCCTGSQKTRIFLGIWTIPALENWGYQRFIHLVAQLFPSVVCSVPHSRWGLAWSSK